MSKYQFKTTNIKGKEYVEVNERIKFFRLEEKYNGWSLSTEVVHLDENSCVIRATICNADGMVIATGFAQEDKSSSYINKTSYVENCETSAWGRALANLGIGIDTSIASAEEVGNAVNNQNKKEDARPWLTDSQLQGTLSGTKAQAEKVMNGFRMKKEYRAQIKTKFSI